MRTLLVACSVFMDKDSYKRHLKSIPYYIDQITLDGKYKDFDYPDSLSSDGTREVAKSNYNVKLLDVPNLIEIKKRQVYLSLFNPEEYKFLIVVDSDEFFIGDWTEFILELDDLYEKIYRPNYPVCIGINTFNTTQGKWDFRPRIWTNAHKVLMGPKHFEYHNVDTGEGLTFSYCINSMKIGHNYNLRHETYTKLRDEYQKVLIVNEGS